MRFHLLIFFPGLLFWLCSEVSAQVVPDSSLGEESSVVTSSDQIDVITGGARRDENLFHSFEEFSIQENWAALFQSDQNLLRIFARVTGNDISEIYGTLGVLGPGDLFLLNDRGIHFGPDAALSLEGSFIAATTDVIEFSDGTDFSLNAESTPILTNSVPVGLGFSDAGSISVENTGNTLASESLFSPGFESDPVPGLSVLSGQEIILAGGEINFEGGIIRAPGGSIEVVSIQQGFAEISESETGLSFSYSEGTLGDVTFDTRSLLTASGITGGGINIQGGEVAVLNNSVLGIDSFVGIPGVLQINAESLIIDGQFNLPDGSGIDGIATAGLFTTGLDAGNAPDLVVEAESVTLTNGAQIQSISFGDGSSGNISVESNEIHIVGFEPTNTDIFSSIASIVFGNSEKGGDISVIGDSIELQDGGTISSTSILGNSSSGDVSVEASEITISGGITSSTTGFPSNITSSGLFLGSSGDVEIIADELRIENGGRVGTQATDPGNAGDTNIIASQFIEIDGKLEGDFDEPSFSRISSNSNTTDNSIPTGNAGSITIETPRLTISDEGTLTVTNSGSGEAGEISVFAEEIRLLGGRILASNDATGEGGNIVIDTNSLFSENSTIAAESDGNGGNVDIRSNILGLFEASRISANAQQGRGGRVIISTTGLFQDPSSTITATSAAGPQLDGTVLIQSPEVDLSRAGTLEAPTVQPPQTSSICAGRQDAGRSEFVVTGTGGVPISPDAPQRSYSGWSDAESSSVPDASLSEVTPSTIVEAQGFAFNPDGTFSLALVADNAVLQSESGHRQNCLSNVPGDS